MGETLQGIAGSAGNYPPPPPADRVQSFQTLIVSMRPAETKKNTLKNVKNTKTASSLQTSVGQNSNLFKNPFDFIQHFNKLDTCGTWLYFFLG
jgi:hypothetical protein